MTPSLAAWQRWWTAEGAAQLDALLTRHWDPLDARFDDPEATLRYQRWRVRLGLRLRHGTTVHEIADLLEEPTRDMAGRINRRQLNAVAREIAAWYAQAAAAAGAETTPSSD